MDASPALVYCQEAVCMIEDKCENFINGQQRNKNNKKVIKFNIENCENQSIISFEHKLDQRCE